MRVESALFSSREGLQSNGQAISVIGDNIANANTTAFKQSRVEFGDLLSEGSNGRQSTTSVNAGSGVQVTAVRPIFENGVIEFTGRALDVAIDGNGFFVTGDAADPVYARAGNLTIDSSGLLATADGVPIYGLQGTSTTLSTINMQSIQTTSSPTSKMTVRGNLNTVTPVGTVPSNPQTFKELGQTASYISTSTAYDSQGVSHDLILAYTKTGTNTWVAQAYMDGADVGGTAGTPKQVGQNLTLNFGPTGTLTSAAVLTANPAYSGGAAAGNFTIDFAGFTQYGSESQVSGVNKDGQGSGQIENYQIGKDGTITAQLTSGSFATVGKIQLADFKNRDGLIRVGQGGFKATALAGDPTIGNPQETGLGGIQSGSLERSTVDIANQFVDLIVYQRGYQANSQTMKAANEIISDTLGLIR